MPARVLSDTPLLIRVLLDTPLFTMSVQLDGLVYGLKFDYSGRESVFYLSVFDAEGSRIAVGLKVVENWDLLRRVSDSRRPPGALYPWSPTGGGPPDLADLGRRVRLLYYPLAPVEATTVSGSGVVG